MDCDSPAIKGLRVDLRESFFSFDFDPTSVQPMFMTTYCLTFYAAMVHSG